jgi:CRISPR/Cas system endoribonuclease Cas6 (RAMP superfamily)
VLPHFIRSFAELANEGLGPNRGRADLTAVRQLDRSTNPMATLYRQGAEIQTPEPPLEFDLTPTQAKIEKLKVEFLAPTELKANKRLVERPSFGVLYRRARDRVSALSLLYQGASPEIEYKELGLRANKIDSLRCDVQWRDTVRRSSRTGQVHPLGGFVGQAVYNGDLGEFMPILTVAQWTGVGRHTVWGKGHIRVTPLE